MGKIIIGIDPGSVVTGYGIVSESLGQLKLLNYGAIKAPPKAPLGERLLHIGQGLKAVLAEFRPAGVSLEKTFFAKNVDSVTKLGHARGVCLYEAAKAFIPVHEYNPTEVKMNIVGYGRAGKEQVQMVICQLLNIPAAEIEKFDMSDALALAVHHCRLSETKQKMREMEMTT